MQYEVNQTLLYWLSGLLDYISGLLYCSQGRLSCLSLPNNSLGIEPTANNKFTLHWEATWDYQAVTNVSKTSSRKRESK